MRLVVFTASALLVLAGCAPVTQVPAEPTGDELEILIAHELDLQWQYVGLTPDSPRPTIERIRLVPMGEAEAVHRQCMIDAGYKNYGVSEPALVGAADNAERLAIYTCVAQYPVPPSSYGLFSEAQLDYLYDFYEVVTVPCLEATGIAVNDMPDRAEFVESESRVFSMWNPYDGIGEIRQAPYLADSKCSYVPEGYNLF